MVQLEGCTYTYMYIFIYTYIYIYLEPIYPLWLGFIQPSNFGGLYSNPNKGPHLCSRYIVIASGKAAKLWESWLFIFRPLNMLEHA